MKRASLQRTDYTTLLDLARTANFKVVEARGLDTRNGIRFHRNGLDWIAINSDLSIREKTRVLGFLMGRSASDVAGNFGKSWGFACSTGTGCVLTLCC
jgi:hypothetical protein